MIVKESIGRVRIGIAAFEEHVKKRIQDPEWTELLVHDPQRATEACEPTGHGSRVSVDRPRGAVTSSHHESCGAAQTALAPDRAVA